MAASPAARVKELLGGLVTSPSSSTTLITRKRSASTSPTPSKRVKELVTSLDYPAFLAR